MSVVALQWVVTLVAVVVAISRPPSEPGPDVHGTLEQRTLRETVDRLRSGVRDALAILRGTSAQEPGQAPPASARANEATAGATTATMAAAAPGTAATAGATAPVAKATPSKAPAAKVRGPGRRTRAAKRATSEEAREATTVVRNLPTGGPGESPLPVIEATVPPEGEGAATPGAGAPAGPGAPSLLREDLSRLGPLGTGPPGKGPVARKAAVAKAAGAKAATAKAAAEASPAAKARVRGRRTRAAKRATPAEAREATSVVQGLATGVPGGSPLPLIDATVPPEGEGRGPVGAAAPAGPATPRWIPSDGILSALGLLKTVAPSRKGKAPPAAAPRRHAAAAAKKARTAAVSRPPKAGGARAKGSPRMARLPQPRKPDLKPLRSRARTVVVGRIVWRKARPREIPGDVDLGEPRLEPGPTEPGHDPRLPGGPVVLSDEMTIEYVPYEDVAMPPEQEAAESSSAAGLAKAAEPQSVPGEAATREAARAAEPEPPVHVEGWVPTRDSIAAASRVRAARRPDDGRIRAIRLTDYHLTWEALAGGQFELSRFPSSATTAQRRWSLLLGERLGGYVAGSIIHPRFWKFELALDLLVLQEWYREADQASWNFANHWRPEFLFDTRLLESHPYPVHLYARRRTDIVRRDFARNFDITTTTAGAEWSWRNKVLPVRVTGQWLGNEFGRVVGSVGDDSFLQVTAEATREGARDTGSLEYRLYRYENEKFHDMDYLAHDFSLRHAWHPGTSPDKRYRLDTFARYTLRYADHDRDDGALVESFTIKWRPELETRTSYQFTTGHGGDVRTYRNALGVDTRYRLWQSLFAGIFVQGAVNNMPGGRQWDGIAGLDVTYRKRLFDALIMSHGLQFVASREIGQVSQWNPIFDEAVTLSGVAPALLRHVGIDVLTVDVMDPATRRRFVSGQDYEAIAQGDRAVLARVPTGDIIDGATVLVSYRYKTDASDVMALDTRYSGRLQSDFSKYVRLSLEVREQWTTRWTPRAPGWKHERLESVGGGIAGNYKWLWANFDAHWYRSLGYTSVDHSGSVTMRPQWRGFVPVVGARYLLQWYGRPATQFRRYYEVSAEGTAALALNLTTTFQWRFHREDGGSSDGYYLDGQTFLDWNLRAMRLRLEYRLRSQVRPEHWYQNHRVFVSVGRPF